MEGRGEGEFFNKISAQTGLDHQGMTQLFMEREAAKDQARGVENPKPTEPPPLPAKTLVVPAPLPKPPKPNPVTDPASRAARRDRLQKAAAKMFSDWQQTLGTLGGEEGVLRPGSEILPDMKGNSAVWNDLIAEGAALFHDGVRGKAAWMAEAMKMAGDKADILRPQLEDLWQDVKTKAPQILAGTKYGSMPSVKQMEKDIMANRPRVGLVRQGSRGACQHLRRVEQGHRRRRVRLDVAGH